MPNLDIHIHVSTYTKVSRHVCICVCLHLFAALTVWSHVCQEQEIREFTVIRRTNTHTHTHTHTASRMTLMSLGHHNSVAALEMTVCVCGCENGCLFVNWGDCLPKNDDRVQKEAAWKWETLFAIKNVIYRTMWGPVVCVTDTQWISKNTKFFLKYMKAWLTSTSY